MNFKSYIKRSFLNSITKKNRYEEKKISYCQDSLITWHHFGGQENKNFQNALLKARSMCKHNLHNEWRLFMAINIQEQLISRSLKNNTEYTYTECGVGEGHTVLVSHLYFQNLGGKVFEKWNSASKYLFDTFNGADKSLVEKNDKNYYLFSAYEGGTFNEVKYRLQNLDNCNFVKGSVPNSLDNCPEKCRTTDFLHVDMNHSVPEVAALKFFASKMNKGSVILLDDYSFSNSTSEQQRIEINKWCDEENFAYPINLPTGQGIMLI